MPKAKNSFYGVRVGKEGPKVYSSWDEVRAFVLVMPCVTIDLPFLQASSNVTGFPGAKHKSFPSRAQAEAYIATPEPQIRVLWRRRMPP
jgi:viroplasmin and RNaseH domain-containing protein